VDGTYSPGLVASTFLDGRGLETDNELDPPPVLMVGELFTDEEPFSDEPPPTEPTLDND
jgi:hypothetical protein